MGQMTATSTRKNKEAEWSAEGHHCKNEAKGYHPGVQPSLVRGVNSRYGQGPGSTRRRSIDETRV